jgi:MarR family transcriptional regulator, lower aerobic nicotinate degradation pathway regulator
VYDESCGHRSPAKQRLAGTVFWLLGRASLLANRLTQERLAAGGMRRGHYGVLATLADVGSASQADLCRYVGVDRSDMVAILNDLQDLGYVERAPDPADRRRNIVVATPAGLGALDGFDRIIEEADETLLAGLSVDQKTALVGILEHIVSTVDGPSGLQHTGAEERE